MKTFISFFQLCFNLPCFKLDKSPKDDHWGRR